MKYKVYSTEIKLVVVIRTTKFIKLAQKTKTLEQIGVKEAKK